MAKIFTKGFDEYYNNRTLYNEEEVMLAAREYVFCNYEFTKGPFSFDNFNCESFDEDTTAVSLIGESVFSICSKKPMFIYKFQAMLFRCLSKDLETFLTEMNYVLPKKTEEIRNFIESHFIESRNMGYIIPIEECNCLLSLKFGIVEINNYALLYRVNRILKQTFGFVGSYLDLVDQNGLKVKSEEKSKEETAKEETMKCLHDICINYHRQTMYNSYPELRIEDFVSKECFESLEKYDAPITYYETTQRVHLKEFPFD